MFCILFNFQTRSRPHKGLCEEDCERGNYLYIDMERTP